VTYQHYLDHISAYEREFKPWEGRVDKIVKRYRDDARTSSNEERTRFNVLWSNVQTLKAATYARTPMPDVSRRFKDNDPVGRVAALLLERALEFQVRHFRDYGATLAQVTYDRFLGGRGTAWVRYEPTFKPGQPEEGEQLTEDAEAETPVAEEIEDENCPTDYVHWRDFGHQVARTWEECYIVWRKVYMTKAQAEKRFPKVTLPMDASPDEEAKLKGSMSSDGINKQALVYEIWDKETGRAVWLSKSLGKIVDKQDDPLGLEEFFPCPPPIYATLTTDNLIPVPDFTLYQDQANELDTLSDRIDGLIKALQIRGVHDSSIPALGRIFTEAGNTDLIPVDNWAAFAEKKGLSGAIDLVDILPIAQALKEAYMAFDQVKGQIYELTGISDILRGETAPSETATAQQIKNSYASLRLKVYQNEVEKFATRLLQLKAQVICNHFDPQTIANIACWEQLSDADKQYVFTLDPTGKPTGPGPALMMLKQGMTRSFRVEVETDSMAYQDEQQDKQDRMEFLQATGGFLDTVAKTAEGMPDLLPLSVEMLKFAVTGFRVGKSLEGSIDQAVDQIKQMVAQQKGQPKPNPEAMKAQAAQGVAQVKAQADTQNAQLAEQAETQREQMRIQAAQQTHAKDQAHEAQLASIKSQNDHAMDVEKLNHDARMADLTSQQAREKLAHEAQMKQADIDAQMAKTKFDNDTKILIAQISAKTTMDAATLAAEQGADEEVAKENGKTVDPNIEKILAGIKDLHDQANAPTSIVRGPDGKATGIQRGSNTRMISRGPDGKATGLQ